MLVNLKVNEFIDTVASSAPAPGGGSCSSLAVALGCGLSSMVCQLTIGKKIYDDISEKDKESFEKAFGLLQKNIAKLTELIDKDTEAFNKIMDAFKLPKETEDEKKIRSNAIQEATWHAIATPYQMSELALESLQNLEIIAKSGNSNAISDLGVGVLLLVAGLKGANMNVKINLSGVKDKLRAEETLTKITEFEKKAEEISSALLSEINAKL